MKLALSLQCESRSREVPSRATLRRWLTAALSGRRERAELTVRIVDEEEGAALNERWRGKRGATNVLSFPAGDVTAYAPDLLGDIVICAPVVEREARGQSKPLDAHWAHMIVHGSLHLLGYGHERDEEARIMEDAETAILARLGYPDPYRAPD